MQSCFRCLICELQVVVFILAMPMLAYPAQQGDDSTMMSRFYAELERVVADSSGDLIAVLQDFIIRNPQFDRAYNNLLEHYRFTDQLPEAKSFFGELAKKKRNSRNGRWMLAKIAEFRNDPQAALQAFMQALRNSPGPELLTDFLLFDLKNFKKYSTVEFRAELNLDPELRDLADALHTFLNLDFGKATQQLEQLPERILHHPATLYNLGYCYYRQRQNETAELWWRKGLELSRQLGDRKSEAKLLMVLGILKRNSRNPHEALANYDSSYAIARGINDIPSLEYLAGNRAIIHRDNSEYAKADTLFRQAISYSERLKSDWKLSVWYSHMGLLFYLKQQYDEALKYYDLSAQFAQKSNNQQKLIEALLNQADINKIAGQTRLAARLYAQAYDISTSKNIVEFIRRAREGLADTYRLEGRNREARGIYNGLLNSPVFQDGYLRRRAYWHFQIARSCLAEKVYTDAKSHLERAHKLARSGESDNLALWSSIYLGRMQFLEGRLADAEEQYLSALERTKPDNTDAESAIHVGLGEVHKTNEDIPEAIQEFKIAASIIEKTRARLKTEQFRVAYFVDASEVYENIIDCYHQLYVGSEKPDMLDSLYLYLESTRGRTLRELRRQRMATQSRPMQERIASGYGQVCQNLQRRQRALRQQAQKTVFSDSALSQQRADIEISRLALIEQRLRLTENLPAFKGVQESPQQALFGTATQAAHRDYTILLYHLSEESAFVLALTRKGIEFIPLTTTETEIESAVNALMAPLHEFTRETFAETRFNADIAFNLFEKLFSPVEAAVDLSRNLVIVPDMSLLNLPFEMLLTQPPDRPAFTPTDKPTYAQHFLQKRYAFTYNPSSLLLERGSRWRLQRPSIAVYANPLAQPSLSTDRNNHTNRQPESFAATNSDSASHIRQIYLRNTGISLEPLPFAGVEAARIAEIAPWCELYEKDAATETSFQNAVDYDILHFATHGFVDSTYDAFSGLVLSAGPDATDDGFLMGYEIAGLNLDADLVTLSACETGRGKPVAGEGTLGLPRLFLSAGAKSVLMTRWKIVDLVSSQLMPEFYKLYLLDGLRKSEALAKAKRGMISDTQPRGDLHYQHPLFWAAFTMFGDPGEPDGSYPRILLLLATLATIMILLVVAARSRRQRSN